MGPHIVRAWKERSEKESHPLKEQKLVRRRRRRRGDDGGRVEACFFFFFFFFGNRHSFHFSSFIFSLRARWREGQLLPLIFSVRSFISFFLETAMTTRSSRGPGGATAAVATAPQAAMPTARRPDGGSGSESSDFEDEDAVFEAAAVRAGATGALVCFRSSEAEGKGKWSIGRGRKGDAQHCRRLAFNFFFLDASTQPWPKPFQKKKKNQNSDPATRLRRRVWRRERRRRGGGIGGW